MSAVAAGPGMLGAFAIALAIAACVLAAFGTTPAGVGAALRVTARWSFLLFWLAYAGRGIASLSAGPMPGSRLAGVFRRGREWGLAFASAHLVHLGLVIWLYRISGSAPVTVPVLVFFLIGAAWTYLLAGLSFGGLAQALGERLWRGVREIGMNYILLAFARDLVPPVLHSDAFRHNAIWWTLYAPFAAMCVAAPFLRYMPAAWFSAGVRQSTN